MSNEAPERIQVYTGISYKADSLGRMSSVSDWVDGGWHQKSKTHKTDVEYVRKDIYDAVVKALNK